MKSGLLKAVALCMRIPVHAQFNRASQWGPRTFQRPISSSPPRGTRSRRCISCSFWALAFPYPNTSQTSRSRLRGHVTQPCSTTWFAGFSPQNANSCKALNWTELQRKAIWLLQFKADYKKEKYGPVSTSFPGTFGARQKAPRGWTSLLRCSIIRAL